MAAWSGPVRSEAETAPGWRRCYPLLLLPVWLACAALLCLARSTSIIHFDMLDADDSMRLLQVRDWLAGQSWFDVTQYRLDPPTGFAMHWSRLVDVPVGLIILLVRPLFGEHIAETAACVAVPMLTLGAAMAVVASITRRLAGEGTALLAAALCTLSFGTFYAMRPMRIDHHGWQIVAGLGIVQGLLAPRTRRRAGLAGLSAALWVHISLEGMVFAAAAGAWLGLRWLVRPEAERWRLPAFLGGLAAGSLALFLVAHGGALFDRTFCDAVSPVHLTIFAVAALGATAAQLRPAGFLTRAAMLGATAVACALLYRHWAPQCLVGPFNTLDPLTYRLWYENIGEGMPLWNKPPAEFAMWLLYPMLGMAGAALLARRAREAATAADALDLLALLAAATLIGVAVLRAGAFSNMLAIPAATCLLVALLRAISALPWMPVRVIGLALAPLLLNPVSPGLALAGDDGDAPKPASRIEGEDAAACRSIDNLTALQALPAATIMTPIDLAPPLLVATHHSAVGAGYHRNPQAMHDVLAFFTADEATAHVIAARHRIAYVLACPTAGEFDLLRREAAGGLAARIVAGDTPGWLRPLRLPGLHYAKLYRVTG